MAVAAPPRPSTITIKGAAKRLGVHDRFDPFDEALRAPDLSDSWSG
jgi:hypothetical protein